MNTEELLKRVRRIEIKTRRLSSNRFAGEYHSAFKGKGMSFSEVREYQYGDDIRDIDWNVTARFNHPYVKVFEEERELTVMLLIDVSGSLEFGTQKLSKKDLVAEIAATLSFSAIENNDKIGVLFFTDRIEKYIPPKSGRKHILYIIRELLTFQPQSRRTNLSQALEFLMKIQRKQCAVFVISDFILQDNPQRMLAMASGRYDVNAIQVYDLRMRELPNVGLLKVKDLETGYEQTIDTSSRKLRALHATFWDTKQRELQGTLNKCNVRSTSIRTDHDYVKSLINLFSERK